MQTDKIEWGRYIIEITGQKVTSGKEQVIEFDIRMFDALNLPYFGITPQYVGEEFFASTADPESLDSNRIYQWFKATYPFRFDDEIVQRILDRIRRIRVSLFG